MAMGDRERELRNELARLDAEAADGERNADDVAAKVQRRREVEAELARLGAGAVPGDHRPTTFYPPR